MQLTASNRFSITRLFSLLSGIVVVFSAAIGSSQISGTGSIQGSVADATGAVIPEAGIVLTNIATGVARNTVSSHTGLYSFPNIDIGTYTMTVTAPGFKTYDQQRIILEVGSSIGINVVMTVGETSQKVEVEALGLALQTEDSSYKQTIDEKTLTELPLNGRQITALIALSGRIGPGQRTYAGQQGLLQLGFSADRGRTRQPDGLPAGWRRQQRL